MGTIGILLVALLASSGEAPRRVPILAKRYAYAPSEVRVRKGESVELELTSGDRAHGFALPAFGVDVKIEPGKTTRVALRPDKAGTFEFHCSVFCGSGHEDMTGALVVTE